MAQQKPDDDFFGFDELLKPIGKSDQSENTAEIQPDQSETTKSTSRFEETERNLATRATSDNEPPKIRPGLPGGASDGPKYANLSGTSKKVHVTFGDIRYDDFNKPIKHGQFENENEMVQDYKKPKKFYKDSFDAYDSAMSRSRDPPVNRRARDTPGFDQSAASLSHDGPDDHSSMSHDDFSPSREDFLQSRDQQYRSTFEANMQKHRAKFGLAGSFGRPRELIEAQKLVDKKFGPDKLLNMYEQEADTETDDVTGHVTEDVQDFDQSAAEHEHHVTADLDDQSGMTRKQTWGSAKYSCDLKEGEDVADWSENEEPMKARDFIDKLRQDKEKEKLKVLMEHDRDGSLMALQKIWSFIPDVYKMTNEELIDLLVKSVIFNENELIAINKPYGLSTIGGTGVDFSLSSLLEDLRKHLAPDSKRLYLVHRLDKSTTGALMIATSEARLKHIKKLIAERKLTKRYWCITKGVPEPPQGVIKIPLGQCDMGRGFKCVPLPNRDEDNKDIVRRTSRQRFEAITEYKVLSAGVKCSLVETNIVTGVKHQIRSHLGFGLNCPIMGDHKYSNFLKMVPQRLAAEVLYKLGIRASKARHLPMYLHAKDIIIPEFSNGKNAFIRAPVPNFFLYTLKKLKLMAR